MGSFIIGAIELYFFLIVFILISYLGYHLAEQNVSPLIGEGVDVETYNQIIALIKENPFVLKVNNVKTILIGPHKFKLVAEITYDIDV